MPKWSRIYPLHLTEYCSSETTMPGKTFVIGLVDRSWSHPNFRLSKYMLDSIRHQRDEHPTLGPWKHLLGLGSCPSVVTLFDVCALKTFGSEYGM